MGDNEKRWWKAAGLTLIAIGTYIGARLLDAAGGSLIPGRGEPIVTVYADDLDPVPPTVDPVSPEPEAAPLPPEPVEPVQVAEVAEVEESISIDPPLEPAGIAVIPSAPVVEEQFGLVEPPNGL